MAIGLLAIWIGALAILLATWFYTRAMLLDLRAAAPGSRRDREASKPSPNTEHRTPNTAAERLSRRGRRAFYVAMGGPVYDPYNLDDDGDGVACEEWTHQYDENASGADDSNGRDGVDKDCAEFPNQPVAQRYFQTYGGSAANNVDHLDPNHKGLACEKGEPG